MGWTRSSWVKFGSAGSNPDLTLVAYQLGQVGLVRDLNSDLTQFSSWYCFYPDQTDWSFETCWTRSNWIQPNVTCLQLSSACLYILILSTFKFFDVFYSLILQTSSIS